MPLGKSTAFTASTKLITAEWHYMEIFYTTHHPIRPRNMEITGKN
jgi:hypothetical protein